MGPVLTAEPPASAGGLLPNQLSDMILGQAAAGLQL